MIRCKHQERYVYDGRAHLGRTPRIGSNQCAHVGEKLKEGENEGDETIPMGFKKGSSRRASG